MNDPHILSDRRRDLRRHPTPAEARLWAHLSNRQLDGFKFRRQHGFGRWIVDFYCPAGRLVVELDGAAHDSEIAARLDAERDTFLASLGLKILRIENNLVARDIDSVLAAIRLLLTGSDPLPRRSSASRAR